MKPTNQLNRHATSVITKALAGAAHELVLKVAQVHPTTADRVSDAVCAAARIVLANRIGEAVYWYGPSTTLLLARADLDILYQEADTLANAIGDGPGDVNDDAPDTERSPCHGTDEDPGDPSRGDE